MKTAMNILIAVVLTVFQIATPRRSGRVPLSPWTTTHEIVIWDGKTHSSVHPAAPAQPTNRDPKGNHVDVIREPIDFLMKHNIAFSYPCFWRSHKHTQKKIDIIQNASNTQQFISVEFQNPALCLFRPWLLSFKNTWKGQIPDYTEVNAVWMEHSLVQGLNPAILSGPGSFEQSSVANILLISWMPITSPRHKTISNGLHLAPC